MANNLRRQQEIDNEYNDARRTGSSYVGNNAKIRGEGILIFTVLALTFVVCLATLIMVN